MPILRRETISSARRQLLERSRVLRSVEFGPAVEKIFTLAEISRGDAETGIATWLTKEAWPYPAKQPSVYTITASDLESAKKIAKSFPDKKKFHERGYAVPQVNDDVVKTTTLYVGSSEGIRSRLKQHLWQAYPRTYALNLQRWCPERDGSVTVRVQPILNNRDRQVRQDLEDALWRELTPIYGKQGGH